jgi:DNA polymerase-1
VDVYDLTVEDTHNFIANEICVHNSNPNFQNLPSRNKEAVHEVKSLLYPMKGHKLAEYDQSGLELRGAGMIANDSRIKYYIENPLQSDMHKNMACRLFMLEPEAVTKNLRSSSKTVNFALLYGSYYVLVAQMTWKQITSPNAIKDFGFDVLQHVKKKGCTNYEEWEAHVESCEKWFWQEEFKALHNFRKEVHNEFVEKGQYYYVNGFTYTGPASRNAICNAVVQGPSASINFYTLVNLQKEIDEKQLQSRILGQIHDSIVVSIHPDEEEIIDRAIWYYGTVQVREEWDWITMPLEIEKAITPEIDQPWSEKKEVGVLHG